VTTVDKNITAHGCW